MSIIPLEPNSVPSITRYSICNCCINGYCYYHDFLESNGTIYSKTYKMLCYFTRLCCGKIFNKRINGRHEDIHFCILCEGKQLVIWILCMWVVAFKTKQNKAWTSQNRSLKGAERKWTCFLLWGQKPRTGTFWSLGPSLTTAEVGACSELLPYSILLVGPGEVFSKYPLHRTLLFVFFQSSVIGLFYFPPSSTIQSVRKSYQGQMDLFIQKTFVQGLLGARYSSKCWLREMN